MGRHDDDGLDPDDIYQRRARRPNIENAAYGWSSSGNIIVPIVPFGAGGETSPIEKIGPLQIRFPKPGYHTVQFNLIQKRPAINEDVLNPLAVRAGAEIIWSVQGNSVRRQINVTDGTAISGTGEGANILVFDDSFVNGVTDAEYEYDVSMQVTPGARPNLAGSQPPIKNAELGFYGVSSANEFVAAGSFSIANAAVPPLLDSRTSIYIPQNCGINSYHLNIAVEGAGALPLPAGDSILITQSAGSPNVAQDIGTVNYNSINKWNPITPGAKIIQITNRYELVNPSHLFGFILFGVDG